MTPPSSNATRPPEETNGPEPFFDSELSQWRLLLTVVFFSLFLSFSFNIFLLKQNRLLMLQIKQQNDQLAQITELRENLKYLKKDSIEFCARHPDLLPILAKNGINVTIVPSNGDAPANPFAPPPSK